MKAAEIFCGVGGVAVVLAVALGTGWAPLWAQDSGAGPKSGTTPAPQLTIVGKAGSTPNPQLTINGKTNPSPSPQITIDGKTNPSPTPQITIDGKGTPSPAPQITIDGKAAAAPNPKLTIVGTPGQAPAKTAVNNKAGKTLLPLAGLAALVGAIELTRSNKKPASP